MRSVELKNISKRFGVVIANDRVDLKIKAGEIHCLLGHNGAGKSTLMKILYGLYQPDSGSILVDSYPALHHSPADAISNGIGYVPQHPSLISNFTVAENLILGRDGTLFLNTRKLIFEIKQFIDQYQFSLSPYVVVNQLTLAEQQQLEILRVLYKKCSLIVFDETINLLNASEIDSFYKTLLVLKGNDISSVLVTHKIEEALKIGEFITVLRKGKVVISSQAKDLTALTLAQTMIGAKKGHSHIQKSNSTSEKILFEVNSLNLSKKGNSLLKDISFNIRSGEILSVVGVSESGINALSKILNGLEKPDSGSIFVNGCMFDDGIPQSLISARISRIPEDRFTGVVHELSVEQNLILEKLKDFTSLGGHIAFKRIRRYALNLIREYRIQATPDQKIKTLSGGNIQKVILARALSSECKILIGSQIMRGLDIESVELIYNKVRERKRMGTAILLFTHDITEALKISDRIAILFCGQIVGNYPASFEFADEISLLMVSGHR